MPKPIKPIVFPEDEQAHDNIIEWWYFNGHLSDKQGNKYSFMDCLFKADVKRAKIPFFLKVPFDTVYFSHSLLTDIQKQKCERNVQYITVPSTDSFKRPLLFVNYADPVIINGYNNFAIEETEQFVYRVKTDNLDLIMRSTKNPMLEGGRGYISVCGRESYYYSLTNLSLKGLIKVQDKFIEVEGKGWMDHQWADVSYNKDKWSWFSLQLDNNIDIMCCEYSDAQSVSYLADVLYADNKQESFNELIMTPLGETWSSARTKSTYPLHWHINIPQKNIDLEVKAMSREQEVIFGGINYWEGPLEVTGTVDGAPVHGQGFMELVGYPSDYSNTALIAREVKNYADIAFKKSKRIVMDRLKRIV